MDEDDDLSTRLGLAASPGLLRRIDDWRRKQPAIPARAAAARMLIERGLQMPDEPVKADSKPGQTNRRAKANL